MLHRTPPLAIGVHTMHILHCVASKLRSRSTTPQIGIANCKPFHAMGKSTSMHIAVQLKHLSGPEE